MCKHTPDAQVAIKSFCCKKWFECPECHDEQQNHNFENNEEMTFKCLKCNKEFTKDISDYDVTDEYCPGCDNHYCLQGRSDKNVV